MSTDEYIPLKLKQNQSISLTCKYSFCTIVISHFLQPWYQIINNILSVFIYKCALSRIVHKLYVHFSVQLLLLDIILKCFHAVAFIDSSHLILSNSLLHGDTTFVFNSVVERYLNSLQFLAIGVKAAMNIVNNFCVFVFSYHLVKALMNGTY